MFNSVFANLAAKAVRRKLVPSMCEYHAKRYAEFLRQEKQSRLPGQPPDSVHATPADPPAAAAADAGSHASMASLPPTTTPLHATAPGADALTTQATAALSASAAERTSPAERPPSPRADAVATEAPVRPDLDASLLLDFAHQSSRFVAPATAASDAVAHP